MTTTLTYAWADQPSPKLRSAFREAVGTWEDVIDVEFREVSGPAFVTVHLDGRFGPGAADILGPGLWLDPTLEQRWGGWEPGTYSWLVAVHEAGHSLGLGHPAGLDMHDSIMSATYVYAPNGSVLNPSTPMWHDIASLVPIYGANPDTAGDRTWHRVTESAGLVTVFDAGGRGDVLDLSAVLAPALVDLGTGTVTYGDGYVHTVGIEGVRLGKGADTVILHPGDIVYGASKMDTLIALDGDVFRLSRREKIDADVRGKWWEVDGAMVEWRGSVKALDAIVVEA